MRAKKKDAPGYTHNFPRAKGRSKFTMEDLKSLKEFKEQEMNDPWIKTFDDLYARRMQAIALEMEPRSSM
jgi:hypothetical protein